MSIFKRKRKNDLLTNGERQRLLKINANKTDNETLMLFNAKADIGKIGYIEGRSLRIRFTRTTDGATRSIEWLKCRSEIIDNQGYEVANPKIAEAQAYFIELIGGLLDERRS